MECDPYANGLPARLFSENSQEEQGPAEGARDRVPADIAGAGRQKRDTAVRPAASRLFGSSVYETAVSSSVSRVMPIRPITTSCERVSSVTARSSLSARSSQERTTARQLLPSRICSGGVSGRQ